MSTRIFWKHLRKHTGRFKTHPAGFVRAKKSNDVNFSENCPVSYVANALHGTCYNEMRAESAGINHLHMTPEEVNDFIDAADMPVKQLSSKRARRIRRKLFSILQLAPRRL